MDEQDMDDLLAMTKIPDNISFYREDPVQIQDGYQSTQMHVGFRQNILDDIRRTIEPYFDSSPTFIENYDDGNMEYELRGTVKGIEHIVSLEHIDCPVPFSMAQIHHAVVQVPIGKEDYLSKVVKQEFLKYEAEFKKSLDEAVIDLKDQNT